MNDIVWPKAVFFDWDGTLVNSIPLLRRAHNYVRVSLGHPEWTESEFYENLKYSSTELYPRIYAEQAKQAFTLLFEFIEEHHLNEFQKLDNAYEVLQAIQNKNLPIGLISNKRHEFLVKEVEHSGWSHFFDFVEGSGETVRPQDKPHGDALTRGFQKLMPGISANEIWYVGDTVTDMLAAQNAHSIPILISEEPKKSKLEKEFNPYLSCHTLKEFLILLT